MADDGEDPERSFAPSTHTTAPPSMTKTMHGPPVDVASKASAVPTVYKYQRRALFQNIKRHDLVGMDDIKGKKIIKPLIGEFVGTFILVFVGCGSCLAGDPGQAGPTTVAISLAFGLTVATIAQAIGHVSGAHLNPAVSFGLIPSKNCSIMKAIVYSAAQILGAILGALLLYVIIPLRSIGYLGSTQISDNLRYSTTGINVPGEFLINTYFAAVGIEFVTTFVLVLIVAGVCDRDRNDVKGSAALAVGLSITVGHLFACQLTGPSMNPARSIGPAIVMAMMKPNAQLLGLRTKQALKGTGPDRSGPIDIPKPPDFDLIPINQIWVYLLGPILGGLAAGTLYRFVFKEQHQTEDFTPPGLPKSGPARPARP